MSRCLARRAKRRNSLPESTAYTNAARHVCHVESYRQSLHGITCKILNTFAGTVRAFGEQRVQSEAESANPSQRCTRQLAETSLPSESDRQRGRRPSWLNFYRLRPNIVSQLSVMFHSETLLSSNSKHSTKPIILHPQTVTDCIPFVPYSAHRLPLLS